MGCKTCGKKVMAGNYTKSLNNSIVKKAVKTATTGTKKIVVNGVKWVSG